MNEAGSVGGRERLRLFCALRLPADAIEELSRWQAGVFAGVAGVRVLAPEQLHVTLAFLGSRPAGELEAIAAELREAARAAPGVVLLRLFRLRRVGFLFLHFAMEAIGCGGDRRCRCTCAGSPEFLAS